MSCCQRTTGQLFLAGQLAERDEQEFAMHLEACACCRNWLHEDAGDPESWQMARELLASDVGTAGVDVGAHGTIDPMSQPNTLDLCRQVLPFLAPADDPAMLGRLGTYEILGIIGRGGMGIVLKGLDPSLRRNVALKMLDPALANIGVARQRFAREARAMAAVSHEHVVPIYGVDERQGLPYFAMEYVAGGTLEHRIHKTGALDPISTVRIAMQVAEALAAAHAQGLVHRDIKPGNILLDLGTERVRVADFGLAQIASDTSDTRSGMITGTPQYMSPEQVRGEACDARSDLFSLGSVLYAMCAGHAPFRAQTVYGVMQRIVHDEPRSLRAMNSSVPEWLDQFISILLAKESHDRFPSASDVAGYLRAELAHLQSPTDATRPARPWCRTIAPAPRRLRCWGLVSLGATTAAVLIGIVTWQSMHVPLVAENKDDTSVSQSSSDSTMEAKVPLWDTDRVAELATQVDHWEESIYHMPDDEDMWQSDMERIQQRLHVLEQEPF